MSIKDGLRGRRLKPLQSMHSRRQEKRNQSAREFCTVSQLAKLLQLNEMTIYRMVNKGKLPCYVIGRAIRFKRSEVLLESHRSKGPRKAGGKTPANR
jgi:excisionase family DNA binding protein